MFLMLVSTDIDECSLGAEICGTGNTCTNSEGGFYCTCSPGYVPAVDRRSCIGKSFITQLILQIWCNVN